MDGFVDKRVDRPDPDKEWVLSADLDSPFVAVLAVTERLAAEKRDAVQTILLAITLQRQDSLRPIILIEYKISDRQLRKLFVA